MMNMYTVRRCFWGVPSVWDMPFFNRDIPQIDVVPLLEKEISRKLTDGEVTEVKKMFANAPANGSWLVILFLAIAWLLSKTGERKPIERTELRKLLEKNLGGKRCGFMELDIKYYVPLMKETIRFLQTDLTDRENYIKEYYDCDDFARRLWGQLAVKEWAGTTFGIAWSQIHMYNMLVVQDPDYNTSSDFQIKKHYLVRLVEPQNDKLLDPKEVKDMQVLYTQKEFDGKSFWVPVNEYLPSGVKLRRNRPLPSAVVATKDKNKKEVSLNPYDTIGIMM